MKKLLHAAIMAAATAIPLQAAGADTGGMQEIDGFSIDRTEVSIGDFRRFVEDTGLTTKAEQDGGGLVYGAGWQTMAGWVWHSPFGEPGGPDEPAVHVTYDEAAAYCAWAGKRLPTDAEWVAAAFTEHRAAPPAPFEPGVTYPYPTGDSPEGANCLSGCGEAPFIDHSAKLNRGRGHAAVGTTTAGVNGLYDMGANVWEWVDEGAGNQKRTRGSSWWYGADQMRVTNIASKPRDMAVVYIGFRCVSDSTS